MVGVANHRGITSKMSGTGMAYTWVHGTLRNAPQPRGKPQVRGPQDSPPNVTSQIDQLGLTSAGG